VLKKVAGTHPGHQRAFGEVSYTVASWNPASFSSAVRHSPQSCWSGDGAQKRQWEWWEFQTKAPEKEQGEKREQKYHFMIS